MDPLELALKVFGIGALIALAVSAGAALLCGWLAPSDIAGRYAGGAAVSIAFFCGSLYEHGPSWETLAPERHWQWLPHLGFVAMILGGVRLAKGVTIGERLLVQFLLAVMAACLLTPTWSSLQPSRGIWIAILAAYLFLLAALLGPLPERLNSRLTPWMLAFSALMTPPLIAAVVSFRYAEVAAIVAAAVAGFCAASFYSNHAANTRGVVAVYAVLAGGAAFVGCIEGQPPLVTLLLAPAAPLALWIFVRGPLTRLPRFVSAVLQVIAVAAVLGLSAWWAIVATGGFEPPF